MVQNLNCSCSFITGNIKVTCAKVFWLQITYRDCTISQTSKGLLQFHSQTKNIWTFFQYTSEHSLWQALHCSALHKCEQLDGPFWKTGTYSGRPSKYVYKMQWHADVLDASWNPIILGPISYSTPPHIPWASPLLEIAWWLVHRFPS